MFHGKNMLLGFIIGVMGLQTSAQEKIRYDILLNSNWQTIASDSDQHAYDGFEQNGYTAKQWLPVNIPHNWDAYEGYRRLQHGNRHGYAWYRRTFSIAHKEKGKRYFLWFEGVGSYATVWVNGKKAGVHAGGRTTFTIDITDLIKDNNQPNILAVRADHPAGITDLPWVCGGCSQERGFSEGSQPMGIFRPVHLVVTNDVRVEPFGVHIWNDTTVSERQALLHCETTFKNYSDQTRSIVITQQLLNKQQQVIVQATVTNTIQPAQTIALPQQLPVISKPHLWNIDDPYCYTLVTTLRENGKLIDITKTPYGIRSISWPVGRTGNDKRFFLNGKPVFINGIGEYEHLMGASHAFSDAAIDARMQQIKAAGFNAFRDAHQPHNLRYERLLDSMGILWWTQLSAHVWYDSPAFRNNFKTLLKEWVIERRNSPSLILWGLQNESKLPEDFARECTDLIRELDPTASSQRKVTTCNGGAGTDWDVPQNWTGTYGGDPNLYGSDVKRQVLIGEYGAWRTLDLHTEGPFVQNGALSEDRMTQLMEMKIRLAESVKDSACGQFFWIYTSHDNPGRSQSGEGFRELDRIGPVNYKGLLTPWEEPLDVFYMYRSNYAPKTTSPMVYIVSHTWPDRWITTGKKDSIIVYSNCDEVELFNDVNAASLGKRTRTGMGTHFQWNGVDINYNVLYAVGYVNGKKAATDCIVLHHLPKAPHFDALYKNASQQGKGAVTNITAPAPGYHYIYRVNCGGADYTDIQGNTWLADRQRTSDSTWGSVSWTQQFPGMPSCFASQRQTNDPISGTRDWPLFQTFRYGLQQLRYEFPVPDGDYRIELYFTEPWWGTGGGMNCTGWRLFDVAVNDQTVIRNLDIWKEAGHDGALKKTVNVHVSGGLLKISFPNIPAAQALICGIAIATRNEQVKPASPSPGIIGKLVIHDAALAKQVSPQLWLNTGDRQYTNSNISFAALPPTLYGAEWIRMPQTTSFIKDTTIGTFEVTADADVFVAINEPVTSLPKWMDGYEDTKMFLSVAGRSLPLKGEPEGAGGAGGGRSRIFRKRFPAHTSVSFGMTGALIVNPVTTLQPAFDLKPVNSYKLSQAIIKGAGVEKQTVNNRDAAVFTQPAGGVVEFTIDPGVADIYSFTFRYSNPAAENTTAQWQLLAADGTVMKTEPMVFTTTKEGKWNYFTSTSGSMINAGKYTVRITAVNARQTAIGGLDVQ